jgi:hypothetical protein
MSGFNIAEEGHVVPYYPRNITGGAITTSVINMEAYSHLSFIVNIGVASRAAAVITIESCSALGGGGTNTAIDFTVYKGETIAGATNWDVLGAAVAVDDVTGVIPPAVSTGIFYVIELESTQLVANHVGFRLCIANAGDAQITGIVGILSGARYKYPQSVTAVA